MASTLPEVSEFLLLTSLQTPLLSESEAVPVVTGPPHSSLPVALGFSARGKNAGLVGAGRGAPSIPLGALPGRSRAGITHAPGGAGTWSRRGLEPSSHWPCGLGCPPLSLAVLTWRVEMTPTSALPSTRDCVGQRTPCACQCFETKAPTDGGSRGVSRAGAAAPTGRLRVSSCSPMALPCSEVLLRPPPPARACPGQAARSS